MWRKIKRCCPPTSVSSPERSPMICFTNILTRDDIVPGLEQRLRETIGYRILFTTVFVDTRLWKTKHPWKRFQNFRQSCVLLTDLIEIHQLQPQVWTSNLPYVMLSGCDWWISIRSVWRLSPSLALLKKTESSVTQAKINLAWDPNGELARRLPQLFLWSFKNCLDSILRTSYAPMNFCVWPLWRRTQGSLNKRRSLSAVLLVNKQTWRLWRMWPRTFPRCNLKRP